VYGGRKEVDRYPETKMVLTASEYIFNDAELELLDTLTVEAVIEEKNGESKVVFKKEGYAYNSLSEDIYTVKEGGKITLYVGVWAKGSYKANFFHIHNIKVVKIENGKVELLVSQVIVDNR
jgi:hypothetical protein